MWIAWASVEQILVPDNSTSCSYFGGVMYRFALINVYQQITNSAETFIREVLQERTQLVACDSPLALTPTHR
jgi:hypothetical protein